MADSGNKCVGKCRIVRFRKKKKFEFWIILIKAGDRCRNPIPCSITTDRNELFNIAQIPYIWIPITGYIKYGILFKCYVMLTVLLLSGIVVDCNMLRNGANFRLCNAHSCAAFRHRCRLQYATKWYEFSDFIPAIIHFRYIQGFWDISVLFNEIVHIQWICLPVQDSIVSWPSSKNQFIILLEQFAFLVPWPSTSNQFFSSNSRNFRFCIRKLVTCKV